MFRGKWLHFDWILLGTNVLIFCFGLVMIFSTTLNAQTVTEGKGAFNLQLLYSLLGIFLFFFFSYLDYHLFQHWTAILYGMVVLLLGTVLITGKLVYGATRWIDLGFIRIQPSEVAKIVMLLVLCSVLARRSRYASHGHFILLSLGLLIIPVGLILLQPDLGTALIFFALWLGLMVGIGVDSKMLFLLLFSLVCMMPLLWPLLKPYQQQRIFTFLDPTKDPQNTGYNVIQAMIAIGAGGLGGVGLGQGTQSQLKFLPVRHTDFIFSVIAEEMGLVGATILLSLVFILLWRILRISNGAVDNFGRYLCIGIFSILGAQYFINIGMNLGIMPVTGIPLPMVSYGGTSLWVTFALLGLAQSVYRYSAQVKVHDAVDTFVSS
ncbi:rod shape-determining protein RodA [Candidatus Wirthbacteria bacterium CG2_30_54_11]|uniref:Rod shape-determining protein RodA n=1 Tax=Candidatus Wirthbacteria bacterium CG2_30_54_11 TaxID=1817892 RepID=A0A1J5IL13_9BACT|nr:MAG: rod shape-determining protein RodA [Candidatus Wirthbacteria bacterium CG2_30_54_11]